ncbi:MAG: hypothetical protein HYW37_02400 [Candidatus Colwellbacteria bacterium]|nr:hypothetical protein [Candidatus Colwellbacteria bacterium]
MTIFVQEEGERWHESALGEALAMLLSQDGEEITIAISNPTFYRRPHEPAILIRRSGDRLVTELSAPRAGVIPVPNRLVISTPHPDPGEREWGLLRFTTDLPVHNREDIQEAEALLDDLGLPRGELLTVLRVVNELQARREAKEAAVPR